MRAGKVGVARKAAEYDVLSDLDHGSIIETTNHHPLDKLEKTRLLHVAINFLKNTIASFLDHSIHRVIKFYISSNPGFPVHIYCWSTVLNVSLIDRADGLISGRIPHPWNRMGN
jgi:hypothetical protein